MIISELIEWVNLNGIKAIGIAVALISLIFLISEIRVYFKHNSSEEMLWFWLSAFLTGVTTYFSSDIALGFFLGISVLMIQQTYALRDVPVWGQLMIATTASYLTILFGKVGQIVYNTLTGAPKSDERIFAFSFSIAFFVFILVAFIFFGKKFILVSRLSSPQMVYLFLFGLIYVVIATRLKELREYFYLANIPYEIARRTLFLSFGIYEILVIVMIFMYFISGALLSFLFGVEEVTDEYILSKVQEIASRLKIKGKVKVGFVKAPILNAFAYGPFFDKRIAFISSDLNDFNESDINGIVGHELAHTAKHHVLILLALSVLELAFKKALLLPATQIDYAVFKDGLTVSFVTYLIISYGLVIFLYIFVRALEGHADKVTKDAGYGKDLSKALYRLEGFYQGVAADFGISVNLLTDKKYTKEEKERYEAIAGKRIYREAISPSKSAAFSNIFVSHPRTSYRIAALVTDKITPAKAAFLPYRLLGLGRKKAVQVLQSAKDGIREIVDETYKEDFETGAFDRIYKFLPWEEEYEFYVGRNVVIFNPLEKDAVEGKLERLERTNQVSSPVAFVINGKSYNSSDYAIKAYNKGEEYLMKKGDIFKPEKWEMNENGIVFQDESGNVVEMKDLGIPKSVIFEYKGKKVYIYKNGKTQMVTLESIEIGSHWKETTLILNGEEFNGSDLIVGFSPIGIEFKKEKTEIDFEVLEHSLDQKVGIFSKENYDVLIPGIIKAVNRDENTMTMLEENGEKVHDLAMVDYMLTYKPNIEFIVRKHVSFFTKISFWWENRKGFNYIY